MRQQIQEYTSQQIENLRKELETLLAAKREGEARTEKQLKNLASAHEQLEEIDKDLDNLIGQVASA